MAMNFNHGYPGLIGFISFLLITQISFQPLCHGNNGTTQHPGQNPDNHEIDFELLNMFGISREFAEQFRVNLLKAIEAEKEEIHPLRQGNQGEYDYEEEDTTRQATTPRVNAFGVLTGIFGIFSGFGTRDPTRVLQSTINFFPPAQRPQAQMVVDALAGYFSSRSRTTASPTPRMRITTGVTSTSTVSSKDIEKMTDGAINVIKSSTPKDVVTTEDPFMSEEMMASPPSREPTTTESFLRVKENLGKSSTSRSTLNQDDEDDFEKDVRLNSTHVQKSSSSLAVYTLRGKSPTES